VGLSAAGLLVSAAVLVAQPPQSALPLRLTGIVFDQDRPQRSVCLIQCLAPGERKGVFAVGDLPCDIAEVKEVRQGSVVIRNVAADRLELLVLPEVARAATLPARVDESSTAVASRDEPAPIVVTRESVRAVLANLPELLVSARAVPRYRDGAGGQRVVEGFEVTEVTPSGMAERLGLRSGDLLVDVNGQVLDGMPTVLRLFGELQSIPKVTLTLLRDGKRLTVAFDTK
jgi:general secretion pathway protein C